MEFVTYNVNNYVRKIVDMVEVREYGSKAFNKQFEINCKKYNICLDYGYSVDKSEFNYYVEQYEREQQTGNTSLANPAEKIKEIAGLEYSNGYLLFRNKPISLVISGKEQFFISYDNKEYKFDEFLVAMYQGKRVNKSVAFLPSAIDKLLKVGPTKRIKIKADILMYYCGLPNIDEQEKKVFLALFRKYYDNDKVKEYYRRLRWKNGLEIMVAFGADLGISGKADKAISDFWCYKYKLDNGKAVLTGIPVDLYSWLYTVKQTMIEHFRIRLRRKSYNKDFIEEVENICLQSLYYQNGRYLSLPDVQIGRPIKGMIHDCINRVYEKISNTRSFNGGSDVDLLSLVTDTVNKCFRELPIENCISSGESFTIDFEKETILVDKQQAARIQ